MSNLPLQGKVHSGEWNQGTILRTRSVDRRRSKALVGTPATGTDFYPTLLTADFRNNPNQHLDGVSFVSLKGNNYVRFSGIGPHYGNQAATDFYYPG
jgi:hypothetical protein